MYIIILFIKKSIFLYKNNQFLVVYNISFFFNQSATNIAIKNENNIININENSPSLINPNGTFIPKNDAIIVGIENTIVIPAKNFIAIFKLFETIVAYVSVTLDKISL